MSEGLRVPPGPRTFPLLGALPLLANDPLAFHLRMSLRYGAIAHARVLGSRLYEVSAPALIEELLTVKHTSLAKDALTRSLRPLVGQGLLTSEGELWRRQRKLCAPPFAPKRLISYEDTMVECAHRSFARFKQGEQRDFHADSMAITLEVVGRTLLGISDARELDQVGQLADTVQAYYTERVNSWGALLPPAFPTRAFRRFVRAKRQLDELVTKLIERVGREDREADHLLARLVRARGEDGQGMSEQQLLDEAVTMLLAGHETTALTLMFAVELLSRHPAEAAKLRQEVDTVLGGRAIRACDLEQMPFLDAVIREALRLYPPAYAFGREAIEQFELGGYTIPKGAQVVVSPFALHRNPTYWSEPNTFQPARWLDGAARRLPRFVYMPFGGGHRVCIGQHFAMLEAGLLLATLVQQVVLEVRPSFKLVLEPVITLRSRHGLPVTVRRRGALLRDTIAPQDANMPNLLPS
jgi:cytochrome P450